MGWFLFDFDELKRLQEEQHIDTKDLILSDLKIRYQWLLGNINKENCSSIQEYLNPDNLDVGYKNLSDAKERLGDNANCVRRIWATPTVCLSFISKTQPETKYHLNICPSKYSDIFWLSALRFCRAQASYDFALVSENGRLLRLSEEPFEYKPPSYEKVFNFFDSNWEHSRLYMQGKTPLPELPTLESLPLRRNLNGVGISFLGSEEAPETAFFRSYSFENERVLATKLDYFFKQNHYLG